MNFLEKLVAEWYGYKGFFVRTNIKFGRRIGGGYGGEMDVIAYEPNSHKIVHIETSTDSDNLADRIQKFSRKFTTARDQYVGLFPFKGEFEQIVIIGLSNRPPDLGLSEVKVKSIPQFIAEISGELHRINPRNNAVPETYPLLRSIQFSVNYFIHS